MAESMSAATYLRRAGILPDTFRPRPRLCVDDLRIHYIPPDGPTQPAEAVLRDYEGTPPPDRGAARPWPNT